MSTTEVATTTPTPEASGGETPSVSEEPTTPSGSEGGTQAADTFAAERERLQSQARSFQSERDKALAEVARLKAEQTPRPSGEDGSPQALTAADVAEVVRRSTQLTQAAERMRGSDEFKHADQMIFDQAHEFDSPEALRVAVADSHATRAAIYQAGFDAGQAAGIPREGQGAVVPAPGPAASGSTAPSTGLPTAEELRSGGLAAMEALRAKYPDDAQGEAEYQRALDEIASRS